MKGLNLNLVGFWADEFREAVAHIARASFGESQTKNVFWAGISLLEDVGDADGQKLRFACTGSGDYEQRAVDMVNSGALVIIERFIGFFEFHSLIVSQECSL